MAIFGFHVITSLIGASVLSKLVSHFCLTRFIYNGLIRYLVPSYQQLMEDAGHYRLRSKGKKRRHNVQNSNGNAYNPVGTESEFYFPRTLPIQLKQATITYQDAALLPLYSSCQWIMNFTICALGVYAVNEFSHNLTIPHLTGQSIHHSQVNHDSNSSTTASLTNFLTGNRLNLSFIWLILTLWFVLRTLTMMTFIYFNSPNDKARPNNTIQNGSSQSTSSSSNSSADWRLVLSSYFLCFILSGFLMLLDQHYFDFRLRDAHSNLTWIIVGNFSETIGEANKMSTPLITRGAFHFLLAVVAAFIGALFVYPGLKYSRLYVDAVKSDSTTRSRKMLLHVVFVAPLLPILLWVLPVTRHISHGLFSLATNPKYQYPYLPLVTSLVANLFHDDQMGLSSLRTLACIAVVLLRIGTVRLGLQAYLSSSQAKLTDINREAGRISNLEVQRLVASVFHCLNLVTLQLLAPAILQLSLVCLLKMVLGHPWLPTPGESIAAATQVPLVANHSTGDLSLASVFTAPITWLSLSDLVQARSVFVGLADSLVRRGSLVARGVLAFLTWWSLLIWQIVCLLGLTYHRAD